ncbi:hypothetical protein NP493_1745g00011 [Ridgeia piscesae]|uniref:RING-type domain-containing protein n=1 Tax=Ridgeia piscesae TaxID=27915 RepID=A0AAD9JUG3_RIDPI|nr:hypothetical protein NP493_1745g00011 [Ridgeia piscesae]
MHYESLRLNTFKTWPNWAAAWPTILVKAGFYYTGTADQVACFCCSGHLKNWQAGDSPIAEHKRYFPQCRFVTGRDSTNIPLEKTSEMPHITTRRATVVVVQNDGPSSLGRLPQGGHSMATSAASGVYSLNVEQLQDMKRESKRLESFADWPTSAYVRPEYLAKAGVYSLGIADRVRCAFCCGVLRNWLPGDDPMVVHRKYFPKCAFLDDARAAGNVPIEEHNISNQQASQNAVANPSSSSELGVVREEPTRQDYSGETSRLSSFSRWPQNSHQTAGGLARAGFFYTGIADCVKCFSCNGTLRSWEKRDDPWTEHARWFPRCNYVRTVKGEAFIRSVQTTHSGQNNGATSTNANAIATQSTNAGTRMFPVEPRAIRARMDTSRVRSVLDMGFSRDLVYNVIEQHLATTGDDFRDVQSLLEAVLAAEKATRRPSSSLAQPARSTALRARIADTAATASNGSTRAEGGSPASTTALGGEATTAARDNRAIAIAHGNGASAAGNDETITTTTGGIGTSEGTVRDRNQTTASHREMKPEAKPATTEDQRLQCKICLDDEAKILFLPCGHLCCCAKCAPALRNCPICRALMRGTVRVYLS